MFGGWRSEGNGRKVLFEMRCHAVQKIRLVYLAERILVFQLIACSCASFETIRQEGSRSLEESLQIDGTQGKSQRPLVFHSCSVDSAYLAAEQAISRELRGFLGSCDKKHGTYFQGPVVNLGKFVMQSDTTLLN